MSAGKILSRAAVHLQGVPGWFARILVQKRAVRAGEVREAVAKLRACADELEKLL
jgi:hypothetical protein